MDREPASVAANQEEVICVYLYVSGDEGEYTSAIYQVKFKHEALVIVELVAKFYEGKDYCFEAARVFNRSKLYCLKRDGGYIIDTNTRARFSSVPPTLASKPTLTLVFASGKLYCLAISWSYKPILETPSR
ncbi:PREDICTED: LOC110751110 isoform, partial [Prunus dulcis]